VVDGGVRLLPSVAGDLDAVRLAAHGVGELAQGGAGAAAGVEQAHGLSGHWMGGPD
jgi:hypothetical protein